MNNDVVIFSIIENMALEENTTFPLWDWTITNDRNLIFRSIPNIESVAGVAGKINTDFLFEKTIAIKKHSIESNGGYPFDFHKECTFINSLLSLIWLYFDNSFFVCNSIAQDCETHYVLTNQRNMFCSTSAGQYDKIKLTPLQVESISGVKMKDNLFELLHTSDKEETPPTNIGARRANIESVYSSMTRIQRSFLILAIARTTSLLPMKIGFYINVLECLLLNQTAELKYRLQINTATFIGRDKDEKEIIMTKVNRAYNIRSSFFHGSSLKNGIEDLQQVSSDIDDIVRKTIIKATDLKSVFNDKNQNTLEEFFKSSIFS